MNLRDAILASILAASDAVWVPNRSWESARRCTLIYERRRDFPATGIIWNSDMVGGSPDAAERTRIGRELQSCAADGMVGVFKPKWARASSVRLTERGDDMARALCGLPTLSAAIVTLDRMRAMKDSPLCIDAGGLYYTTAGAVGVALLAWVSEIVLSDLPWPVEIALPAGHRAALVALEEKLLPLLWRAVVVSGCTLRGVVHYAATALADTLEAAPRSADLPDADEGCRALYYAGVKAALAQMQTVHPRVPNEIGELPLPESPVTPRPGAMEAWAAYPRLASTPECATV